MASKNRVEEVAEQGTTNKLDGLTFVFDDSLSWLVRDLDEVLRFHGATVEERVSSDTDYLIANVDPDKWLHKGAQTHDVPIIDDEGMFEVMDDHDAHEDEYLYYRMFIDYLEDKQLDRGS